MAINQQIILVNENDKPLGSIEKMEAHRKGLRHRAVSVFIFNSNGEMLLQRRAFDKYHSGGLWSNACCTHPRPDEETKGAALRRLTEELGFSTPLTKIFHFSYKASFPNGLIENEFDHVFVGEYEGDITPNAGEVSDYSFRSMDDIRTDLENDPGKYTAWFSIVFPRIEAWWREYYREW